jgi:hypothetical protein
VTPQEELDQALAELAAANARLAAAKAETAKLRASGIPVRSGRAKKRVQRSVHRNELLHSAQDGGGAQPVGTRVRVNMTPVVTKELDPTDRPNGYAYAGRECLMVHDVLEGNIQSDSWQRCNCVACVEIRRA